MLKRFGPIWSVPMHGAIASLPRLIASWTTGVAKSTSQVVKRMFAPWPIRLSAHDFAFDALLFCVSQVLITNLWPAAPPLAFSCLIRIFAAASAGSSNGDICPDLSNAQPITTGFLALDAACPPLVPTSAAIAAAAPRSASTAPHLVARLK